MKINYSKAYQAIRWGDKSPRKTKKHILGRRLTGSQLRRKIKKTKVLTVSKTMYDTPVIEPGLFCPKCGCEGYRGTGNLAYYPEHWESFHCLRCRSVVAYIDNSPFIHVLEELLVEWDDPRYNESF